MCRSVYRVSVIRTDYRTLDAAIGPSTPVSSMLQKKADNTTPTIQAAVR